MVSLLAVVFAQLGFSGHEAYRNSFTGRIALAALGWGGRLTAIRCSPLPVGSLVSYADPTLSEVRLAHGHMQWEMVQECPS